MGHANHLVPRSFADVLFRNIGQSWIFQLFPYAWELTVCPDVIRPNLICCLYFFLSFVCPQAKYISTCIDEIKQELKQDNIAVKANAVCKLTYVRSLNTVSLTSA